MINMGLNEVLDLKECLEDIIEDMDPDHLSGMLSLCAMPFVRARFRCKSSSLPSDIFGGANSREPIAAVEIGVGQSAVSFLKVQFSPTF